MALAELQKHLMTLSAGPIADDDSEIESLIAGSWAELDGSSATSMSAEKLYGRMERLVWTPPVLTFVIERHGGTCCGSSRAELHQWTIDVESGKAGCSACGYRQVSPRNKPQNAAKLVDEVVEIVRSGKSDPRVSLSASGELQIHVSLIVPDDYLPKQTLAGRRKRFRDKLRAVLALLGWKESRRPYRYHRETSHA